MRQYTISYNMAHIHICIMECNVYIYTRCMLKQSQSMKRCTQLQSALFQLDLQESVPGSLHSLGRGWLRVVAGFDFQVLQLLQGLWNCKYKGLLVIKLPNSNIFITAKHKSNCGFSDEGSGSTHHIMPTRQNFLVSLFQLFGSVRFWFGSLRCRSHVAIMIRIEPSHISLYLCKRRL